MRALVAPALAALALVAAGCGGSAEEGYSPAVEESFTAECVKAANAAGQGALSEADAREYCTCAYDDIEANVPFEVFAEYDERAREDENAEPPPAIAAAAERCAEDVG